MGKKCTLKDVAVHNLVVIYDQVPITNARADGAGRHARQCRVDVAQENPGRVNHL